MKALVIGATGLVGNELITTLLADDEYKKVTSLVRRPSGREDKKLTEVLDAK